MFRSPKSPPRASSQRNCYCQIEQTKTGRQTQNSDRTYQLKATQVQLAKISHPFDAVLLARGQKNHCLRFSFRGPAGPALALVIEYFGRNSLVQNFECHMIP